MTRLTYTLAAAGSVLLLAACGGDDTQMNDTEAGTGTGGTGDDGSMSSPATSATMTMSGDDTTGSPTTTPTDESSTGGDDCDPPCLPGQECIAGNCFGDPEPTGGPMCEMWGMNGNYADCIGGESCNGASCVSDNPDNPTVGACAQLGCMDVCDCPDPGDLEGTLVCDTLTADMQNGCYFSCEGGADCPEGMTCLGGFFCGWSDVVAAEPYGDCANPQPGGTPCDEGICAVDDPKNVGAGACASPCMDAGDCPEAPEGGAAPVCGMFGNGMNYCIIPCTGGCPDGMECVADQLCLWPVGEPVVSGFGDCVDPVPNDGCLAEETCFTDNAGNPTNGFCTTDCTMVTDCVDPPETGDAPVACGDLGGGDTCYLDCAGGQTCPDDMVCVNDNYCAFEAQSTVFGEDFEDGAIPATWTLINNDGLTVNPGLGLPFNDDAFIVVADPAGTQAAIGTSWYMPAGIADDWLITPQISLGAASTLAFQSRSGDMMFPDDFEVLISTGGATMGEFMANADLLTVAGESVDYVAHEIDLAAAGYTDQDVYIAFHLTTDDGAVLFIDNVYVTE